MKKFIAMTLTIAMLLGLLTIPAAAVTIVNWDFADEAEAYNRHIVEAAEKEREKQDAAEEEVTENDEPVETVNESDEEVVETEAIVEAEPEIETETIEDPEIEESRPAVSYKAFGLENLLNRLKVWWK